jgi:hypothetical protein
MRHNQPQKNCYEDGLSVPRVCNTAHVVDSYSLRPIEFNESDSLILNQARVINFQHLQDSNGWSIEPGFPKMGNLGTRNFLTDTKECISVKNSHIVC